METTCHTEDTSMSYPEVTPNATAWVWSDAKPPEEVVQVTAHGLRRLLRVAAKAFPFVAEQAIGHSEIYKGKITPDKAIDLLNELSSIWCEGGLVMSRLFVTKEGKAIAHRDDEVDGAATPPWEKK